MTENIETASYFDGYQVELRDTGRQPYPWRFAVIEPDGSRHDFAGIPNQCETKHSARMRGWYRAKWLSEGTYHQHYSGYDENDNEIEPDTSHLPPVIQRALEIANDPSRIS